MLKFLRKYNLIILVVGGSLLMVVFLLQPVLTRLAPDPSKRKIGTIGPDNRKVSQRDLKDASDDIRILGQISPLITNAQLLLEPNRDTNHYYLLLHEAQRAGVVGGSDDGPDWIPQLANDYARIEILRNLQAQGIPQQFWSQFITPEQVAQATVQLEKELNDRRIATAQRLGLPQQRVDQALANARGIVRLRVDLYRQSLRLSAPDTLELARDRFDAALADVLVVPASHFADEIAEPTEEQLLAHFEQYKAEPAGSGELGFGYLQPPSIKLEYLVLDPAAFAAVATPDPVEVRKHWSQNRTLYAGEFADERARIEQELSGLEAERLMVEASDIIRREVLAKTRQLQTDKEGYLVLPDDWDQRRPRFADIAQIVVAELADRENTRIAQPEVQVRAADWLTAQDLDAPPLSTVGYRVGSTGFRLPGLPLVVRENQTGEESPLPIQVGVPLVEPHATDRAGRHYYVTILAARPEAPPDTLDDVRERVTADVTDKLAYERLLAEAPRYEQLARDEGLAAVAALLAPETDDDPEVIDTTPPPAVDEGVLLTRTRAMPQASQRLHDTRVAQATDFLTAAVDTAAQHLDPLAPIGQHPLAESIVWAATPRLRAVVLGRLTAYRPVTLETFRANARAIALTETPALLLAASSEDEPDPFSYESMVARTNFIAESKNDDEDAPEDDATAPEDTESDTAEG